MEKAIGAASYPAGTHSTYKLVTAIWSRLLQNHGDRHLCIETQTPAQSLAGYDGQGEATGFCISTPRGIITATHVVHCTNGHTAHLVPGLRGKLFPVREQMTEQDIRLPDQDKGRAVAFLWRKGFDYFIHRPETKERAASTLLGGALSQSGDDGLDEFGVASDADRGIFIASYLRGLLPTLYDPTKETKLISSWTGIMGWSADLMPWVGPIPSSITKRLRSIGGQKASDQPAPSGPTSLWSLWQPFSWRSNQQVEVNVDKRVKSDRPEERDNQELVEGHTKRSVPSVAPIRTTTEGKEWICGGYSGEGLTHAWGCAKALAYMILGRPDEVTSWFPEEYLITEDRVEKADVRNLKQLY